MTVHLFGARLAAALFGLVPAILVLAPAPAALAPIAALAIPAILVPTAVLALATPALTPVLRPARIVAEDSVAAILVVVALRAIGDTNEQVHYYPHCLCGNAVRS